MTMPTNNYTCMHEDQIMGQSRKIEALETRADYKEEIIKELKDDMKELKDDIKEIKTDINNFILKSVNDDNLLKETLNRQDNRITSLETTVRVLKWLIGIVTSSGVITIIFALIRMFG